MTIVVKLELDFFAWTEAQYVCLTPAYYTAAAMTTMATVLAISYILDIKSMLGTVLKTYIINALLQGTYN